jgi:hypothetical protein
MYMYVTVQSSNEEDADEARRLGRNACTINYLGIFVSVIVTIALGAAYAHHG